MGAAERGSDGRVEPVATDDARRALALAVHERLCVEYGCPIAFHGMRDPLSELVRSLMSHRTTNRASGGAYRRLREVFADWRAVRDAPVAAVRDAIAGPTWPEQKAPRIQAVLHALSARLAGTSGESLGNDALDGLAAMTVRDARDWLESLPGVGPKTSAAVLSFSRLRRAALPVDSHHHRVATRLGLLPPGIAVGPAHVLLERLLPADWDEQRVDDHHQVLMRHGQRVCRASSPACARCAVLGLCPTGRGRVAGRAGVAGVADIADVDGGNAPDAPPP